MHKASTAVLCLQSGCSKVSHFPTPLLRHCTFTPFVQILQYFNTNYANANLQSFCDKNGLPLYKASRILKSELGITFRQLLMQRRFSVAQQLLCTTTLPISQIITAVGYENNSYFYRSFLEHYNCTPQQFRDNNKNNI